MKQVHDKFELMEETLFLTVNIVDRYLAQQIVPRKKLQLVGLVAMLLACKYEEVSVPVVADLIIISDKAYTRKEFIEMVHFISTSPYPFFLSLPLSDSIKSAGEVDAQHIAIQHVDSDPICLHEKVSQSCSIRREG